MGAQWSVYYSYTLGEPFDVSSEIWEICPAAKKDDDEEFTVFIYDKEKHQDSRVDLAVKHFRTLRHPGLLKCHEVYDELSEIAMVTEAVLPLANVIADLHIFEVIAGIHDIIVTLAFLHDKCKLSHNNLSLDSIFVGQNDACWKIAGFENMCSFSEIAKEKLMNDSLVHAKDALGLGKLICDILEQVDISDNLSISNFQQRIQHDIVEASLEKRPEVRSLLDDELFQNEYCEILDFLRNITVKTSAAKDIFFRTLHERLHEVPPHVIANRLLHLLLSRFVLIDPIAVQIFLPHLLTPQSDNDGSDRIESTDIQSLLPENLYRECCVPILRKLFEVNDRHVRLILLKYFHLYVGMFDKDDLKSVILPELRLGLQDSDDELVSATFSALQYLVPLVGAQIVIGGERLQQFTERRPKFDPKEDLLSSGSEVRSMKAEISRHMTSKVKSNEVHSLKPDSSHHVTSKMKEGKREHEKMEERERRREETRRRNEERRKQRQKIQMERKLAMKANVVEHVQENLESGDDFHSWDDVENQEKEREGEISDDSDRGRPSSSEISLDSGFSERPRNITEKTSPRSPLTLRESTMEETNKFAKGKTSFGMKLGKPKQGNTDKEKSGKAIPLKDLAKLADKSKGEDKAENNEWINESNSNTSDIFNTNELQDNFSPNNESSLKSFKQTHKTNDKNNLDTKLNKTQRPNKDKKPPSQVLVDKPWDDFDIKVTKKDSVMDDIFADMAPTLSQTRKAPVKGTSMYSDTLAVIPGSEDVDGWLDDDW